MDDEVGCNKEVMEVKVVWDWLTVGAMDNWSGCDEVKAMDDNRVACRR